MLFSSHSEVKLRKGNPHVHTWHVYIISLPPFLSPPPPLIRNLAIKLYTSIRRCRCSWKTNTCMHMYNNTSLICSSGRSLNYSSFTDHQKQTNQFTSFCVLGLGSDNAQEGQLLTKVSSPSSYPYSHACTLYFIHVCNSFQFVHTLKL